MVLQVKDQTLPAFTENNISSMKVHWFPDESLISKQMKAKTVFFGVNMTTNPPKCQG